MNSFQLFLYGICFLVLTAKATNTTLTPSISATNEDTDIVDSYSTLLKPFYYKGNPSFIIGGLFSLTKDNTFNKAGVLKAEAMRCAIKRIHQNPKRSLPNVTFHYNIQDDENTQSVALYKALTFLKPGITTVIGGGTSSVADAVSKLLENYGIAFVSATATAPQFSDPTLYKSFIRTAMSDMEQTKAQVALAAYLEWQLIAIIHSDDTYGQGGLQGWVTAVNDFNSRIAINRTIHGTIQGFKMSIKCVWAVSTGKMDFNWKDLEKLETCIKKENVKALVLFMNERMAGEVASFLYRKRILQKDVGVIASEMWTAEDLSSRLAKKGIDPHELKGIIGTKQHPGNNNDFMECLRQVNPSNTHYPAFLQFWEDEFRCKVNNSSLPLCPEAITSRQPHLQCRCSGKEILPDCVLKSCDKCSFVQDAVNLVVNALELILNSCRRDFSKRVCESSSITGDDLVAIMKTVSWEGYSGHLSFQNGDRNEAPFSYSQFDGNSWRYIGTFHQNTLSIEEPFAWGNGRLPVSKVESDSPSKEDPLVKLIDILSLSVIVFCIMIWCYFFYYRTHPVVIKGTFCYFTKILGGSVLVNISLIAWSGEASAPKCHLKVWTLTMGFAVVLGAILRKIVQGWIVISGFRHGQARPKRLLPSIIIETSTIIYAFGLLLFWSLYGNPRDEQVSGMKFEVPYLDVKCRSRRPSPISFMPDFDTFIATMLLIASFVLSSLGLALFTRIGGFYGGRNTTKQPWADQKRVGISLTAILSCIIIICPLYLSIEEGPRSSMKEFLIRSLWTWMVIVFVDLCLIFPKFVDVRSDPLNGYGTSGDEEEEF